MAPAFLTRRPGLRLEGRHACVSGTDGYFAANTTFTAAHVATGSPMIVSDLWLAAIAPNAKRRHTADS